MLESAPIPHIPIHQAGASDEPGEVMVDLVGADGRAEVLVATPSPSPSQKEDPSQQIVTFPERATPSEAIYLLSRNIPTNEFGLPLFYYRSDLISTMLSMPHVTQDDVDSAACGLFYHEGYPTQPSGAPFWSPLPHEPPKAFERFQEYLQQVETYGIRQMDVLSAALDTPLEALQRDYREYYWSARARAYDLFSTAAELKKREFRIRKTENAHFAKAQALLEELTKRFQDSDWIEELSAKEAIEVLETLVKIQRLSLGLTGQHASSNVGSQPKGASAEFVLRSIARGSLQGGATSDVFQNRLQQLLLDPEQGMILQEAILKINSPENFASQIDP